MSREENTEINSSEVVIKKISKNQVANVYNALLQAGKGYTVDEQRLMKTLISFIQPDDKDLKKYTIPVSIFKDLMVGNRKDIYSIVKNALNGLASKPLKIEETNEKGNKTVKFFAFIIYVEYTQGKANFIVKIESEFKPYLIGLKDFFSKIPIKYIYMLSSRYSIRLYELLKQYEHTGYRIDKVDELRELLGIEENEYPRFDNFDNRVIKRAINEINEKTDLEITYNKKKTGRKITHIEFFIYQNEKNLKKVKSEYTNKNKKQNKINKTSYASSLDELKEKVKNGSLPYFTFKRELMKIQNTNIANFIDDYNPWIVLRTNSIGHLELYDPVKDEVIALDTAKDRLELENLRKWLYKNPDRIGDIKEIDKEKIMIEDIKDKIINMYNFFKSGNIYCCQKIKNVKLNTNTVFIYGDDVINNKKDIFIEVEKGDIEDFINGLKDSCDKTRIDYYRLINKQSSENEINKIFNKMYSKEKLSDFAEFLDNKSLELSEKYVEYEKEGNTDKMNEIHDEISKNDQIVIAITDFINGDIKDLDIFVKEKFLNFIKNKK